MEWFQQHDVVAWLGLAAVLAMVEMLSGELVLLMLAIGAVAAAGTAALTTGPWLPLAVGSLASVLLLFGARPPVMRRLHDGPDLVTGFDSLIGTHAVVGADPSQARIAGETWSVRPEDPRDVLHPGTEVEVVSIEGATAIVRRVPQQGFYIYGGGPS